MIAKYFYDCIIFAEGHQNNSFIARSFSHTRAHLKLVANQLSRRIKNEGTGQRQEISFQRSFLLT